LALTASLAVGACAHHAAATHHAAAALPPSSTFRLTLGDILLLGVGNPVPLLVKRIDKCASASRVRIEIGGGDEHGSVADQPRAGLGGYILAFRLVIVCKEHRLGGILDLLGEITRLDTAGFEHFDDFVSVPATVDVGVGGLCPFLDLIRRELDGLLGQCHSKTDHEQQRCQCHGGLIAVKQAGFFQFLDCAIGHAGVSCSFRLLSSSERQRTLFPALPWTWTLDGQNQELSSLRSWGLRDLSPLPWPARFSLARPWQAQFSLARPWQTRP